MKDTLGSRDYDWWLLAIVAAICALGVVEIYSATHGSALVGMHTRQIRWLIIGTVLMFIFSRLDYHVILDQAPILYIVGIVALRRCWYSVTAALAPNAGFPSWANSFRCQNWSN